MGSNLRLKILSSLFFFLAILVFLHLFFFVPTLRSSQLDRELGSQRVIASQLANRLDQTFRDAVNELESLAKFPVFATMNGSLIDAKLREIDTLTRIFNYYYVLDTEGRWIAYPEQVRLVGREIPEQNRAWVQSVIKNDRTVFVGVLVSVIDTVVSGFATPIKNPDGRTVGVLRGVFELSDENTILNSIKSVFTGGRGFAYLVDSQGKLLAYPETMLTVESYTQSGLSAFTPVKRVIKGEKGSERYEWKGEFWHATFAPIEVSGWGIVIQQPESEILAVVDRYTTMLVWFFLITFVIGVVMVLFLFGFTLRPLSLLVRTIRDGKVSTFSGFPKNDIGKLAGEFEKMYHDLFESREQLRKEREKYRILVENQTDLIVKTDREGKFLFTSPSFCKLFGFNEALISGKSMFEFTHEEDMRKLVEMFDNVSDDFNTNYMTIHTRTAEGMKWLEWVTSPVRDISGKIEAFVSTGRDITLRMQAEEALAESEDKFRELAEQSPNMIFINQAGKIVYTNMRSEEILGYTRAEMYSRSFDFYSLIAGESIPLVRDLFKKHQEGINVDPYEYSIVNKYGKKFDVINSTKIIRYEGEPAILGIVTDISDRKKTEMALKESEEQYKLVVENANDGIVITVDEKIAFANRKVHEMLGFGINEVLGSLFTSLVHAEDRTQAANIHLVTEAGNAIQPCTIRLMTKASEPLWADISSVTIAWNGKPAVLSFIRNITVQKNLEHELIQAEKMKSIGALAGGIAHDFNNKLQLLSANCFLLLAKRKAGDEDYDELMQMKGTTEKAGDLVKQLLSISKRLRSTLAPVDINTIAEKLLSVLEKSFPKTISLSFKPGDKLWPVNADAGQIEQVIINLAFNSRDALPDGGAIEISTGNMLLGKDFVDSHIGVQTGKHVRLAFSDNGCGMDARTLSHIFEPTFTTKGDKKGFGLGLAMVYNILRNHGGAIFCRSTEGAGTTFEIYFPIARNHREPEHEKEKIQEIRGGTETILVVDDEADILSLALKILPRHGYKVHIANSGIEALEIYMKNPGGIDLVLTDLIMPGMDGRECAEKLFGINRDIKIIMMSGEPMENILDESLRLRLSSMLYKPFDFSELLEKIRSALDKKISNP